MNFEQKYKKAIDQAKKELEACGSLDCDAVRQIFRLFPELAESEGERIRKEIIRYLDREITLSNFGGDVATFKEWIAWLKKQDEHNDFAPKSAMEAIKEEKIDNANKVELKFKVGFKVGDWIVNNINKDIFLIKSYSSGYCTLEDTKGIFYHPCLPPNDEFHLWTVDDAKKGDILQANKCTLIFDSLAKDIDGNTVISSWYYCDTETFYGMGTCKPDLWVTEGVVPATKEQCNILFQKMKEKGYEWDVKEKKLIKL